MKLHPIDKDALKAAISKGISRSSLEPKDIVHKVYQEIESLLVSTEDVALDLSGIDFGNDLTKAVKNLLEEEPKRELRRTSEAVTLLLGETSPLNLVISGRVATQSGTKTLAKLFIQLLSALNADLNR